MLKRWIQNLKIYSPRRRPVKDGPQAPPDRGNFAVRKKAGVRCQRNTTRRICREMPAGCSRAEQCTEEIHTPDEITSIRCSQPFPGRPAADAGRVMSKRRDLRRVLPWRKLRVSRHSGLYSVRQW